MRLLVAVDLSGTAEGLVKQAARWCAGGTVDLVFVDERGLAADYLRDPELKRRVLLEWEANRDRYAAQLNQLFRGVDETHRGVARVERGRPAERIAELAEEYDGVVVATHGRSGVNRLFLGSVAERVARTATVPVLVLRAPA